MPRAGPGTAGSWHQLCVAPQNQTGPGQRPQWVTWSSWSSRVMPKHGAVSSWFGISPVRVTWSLDHKVLPPVQVEPSGLSPCPFPLCHCCAPRAESGSCSELSLRALPDRAEVPSEPLNSPNSLSGRCSCPFISVTLPGPAPGCRCPRCAAEPRGGHSPPEAPPEPSRGSGSPP